MAHRGFHREGLNISKHPFGRALDFYKFPSRQHAEQFVEHVQTTFKRLAKLEEHFDDNDNENFPDLRYMVSVDVEPFCDGHQDPKLETMIENSVEQFGGSFLGT